MPLETISRMASFFCLIAESSAGLLIGNDARAEGGVLEINQSCVATGCFPGDAPGFPVEITQSGSYRMTSSLSQFFAGFGGGVVNAIDIHRSFVQIDMNGFLIACTAVLSDSCPGSADGISLSGGSFENPIGDITVENGTVTGMPGSGIYLPVGGAVIRNVRVVNNGEHGIDTSTFFATGSIVENSLARGNGSDGIRLGFGGLVRGSVSTDNGANSITGVGGFLGQPSGAGYTECVTQGPTDGIEDLGSNS